MLWCWPGATFELGQLTVVVARPVPDPLAEYFAPCRGRRLLRDTVREVLAG